MNADPGTTDDTMQQQATQPAGRPHWEGAPGYPPGYVPPPPPVVAPPRDPRRKHTLLACVLSAMPGLGQIYVGYYPQGFINAIVVASLMALAIADPFGAGPRPLLIMFLVFYWLYNVIDAGRRASLYNQALDGGKEIELPAGFEGPGVRGSTLGGALLLAGGLIMITNTLFDMSLAWLEDWWPVAPIALGAYLLYHGFRDRSAAETSSTSDSD